MGSRNIEAIVREAQELSPEEYKELLDALKRGKTPAKDRSILELEGLGKEMWEKVDVERYIDKERSSWD